MLNLTRCIGETVLIGDDIEVVVRHVHGGQVKLGFKAPMDVEILREEVYLRKYPGRREICSEPG